MHKTHFCKKALPLKTARRKGIAYRISGHNLATKGPNSRPYGYLTFLKFRFDGAIFSRP